MLTTGRRAPRREHPDAVAELDHGLGGRDEVDVAAADARDLGAEAAGEVELADGQAGGGPARDEHPAHVEALALELDVDPALVPEPLGRAPHVLGVADDADEVAVPRQELGRGEHRRAVPLQPAERDARQLGPQLAEARQALEVDPDRLREQRPRLAGRQRPAVRAAQDEVDGEERQQDADRVGERVADDGRRDGVAGVVAEVLEHRGERRGVREAARVDARRRGGGEAEQQLGSDRDRGGQADRRQQTAVRRDPAPAERGDEAGAGREPDGVDEEHEPEVPEHVGELQRRVEGADPDPGEEHGRDAELEAADRAPCRAGSRPPRRRRGAAGRCRRAGRSRLEPTVRAGRRASGARRPRGAGKPLRSAGHDPGRRRDRTRARGRRGRRRARLRDRAGRGRRRDRRRARVPPPGRRSSTSASPAAAASAAASSCSAPRRSTATRRSRSCPPSVRPDPALLAAARRALPEARVLPIGTSARVGGTSGCDVEAMEGFAVLRAAELAGVPAARAARALQRGRRARPRALALRRRARAPARGAAARAR